MKIFFKTYLFFFFIISGLWIFSGEASAAITKSVSTEAELKTALTTAMNGENELQITITKSFTISSRIDVAKSSYISVIFRSSTGSTFTLTKASSNVDSPMFFIGTNDVEFRNINLQGFTGAKAPIIMDGAFERIR